MVLYYLIWQENIVMERRKLCNGTDVLPYIVSWTACFFLFILCVCVFFFFFFLEVCGVW